MERSNVHIGRWAPVGDDGVWLSGQLLQEPAQDSDNINHILSKQFAQRRSQLVVHLQKFRRNGAIEGRLGQS
jgi:hypothetical protein